MRLRDSIKFARDGRWAEAALTAMGEGIVLRAPDWAWVPNASVVAYQQFAWGVPIEWDTLH